MRMALPFIDGAWMGVYDSRRDELLGVAALSLTDWRVPDLTIHPAHRIPGASAEVLLLDSKKDGSWLRFPVENVRRQWMLAVCSRADSEGLGPTRKPKARTYAWNPNPRCPSGNCTGGAAPCPWTKSRDWVVDWPDRPPTRIPASSVRLRFPGHPRKVRAVAELRGTTGKRGISTPRIAISWKGSPPGSRG